MLNRRRFFDDSPLPCIIFMPNHKYLNKQTETSECTYTKLKYNKHLQLLVFVERNRYIVETRHHEIWKVSCLASVQAQVPDITQ